MSYCFLTCCVFLGDVISYGWQLDGGDVLKRNLEWVRKEKTLNVKEGEG